MLINGRGRNQNGTQTPYATFHVRSGFRYRFRIVSPGFTLCPIEVSVENHTLTLIASDTHALSPIEVDSIIGLVAINRFSSKLTARGTLNVNMVRI